MRKAHRDSRMRKDKKMAEAREASAIGVRPGGGRAGRKTQFVAMGLIGTVTRNLEPAPGLLHT